MNLYQKTRDTFFTMAVCFFVKVWRIKDDEISFSFCATCATVYPWDKSAFRRFASAGIFPK